MKDNKGRTRGCIVCTGKDPKYGKGNMYAYKIGISFCNPKDNFDKKTALNIAIGRAKNSSINANVPKNMAAILHDEWDHIYLWITSINVKSLIMVLISRKTSS